VPLPGERTAPGEDGEGDHGAGGDVDDDVPGDVRRRIEQRDPELPGNRAAGLVGEPVGLRGCSSPTSPASVWLRDDGLTPVAVEPNARVAGHR
jgi:hypothetical protein